MYRIVQGLFSYVSLSPFALYYLFSILHFLLYLSTFTIERRRTSFALAFYALAVKYVTTNQLIFYISGTAAHRLRRRAGLSPVSISFTTAYFPSTRLPRRVICLL